MKKLSKYKLLYLNSFFITLLCIINMLYLIFINLLPYISNQIHYFLKILLSKYLDLTVLKLFIFNFNLILTL